MANPTIDKGSNDYEQAIINVLARWGVGLVEDMRLD